MQLLREVAQFGFGKLKKDIEEKLFSAPASFEPPSVPPADGVVTDVVIELTMRAAERRFLLIAKQINPIKWLKLEQLKV